VAARANQRVVLALQAPELHDPADVGAVVVLAATEALRRAVRVRIDVDHADVLVLLGKRPDICKRDRMIASKHYGDAVDVKHFFYLVSHPPMRFNYVAGRHNYVAIVDRAEHPKWVDASLDVKVLVRRRRHR